jgi:hypothetical protein
MRPEVSWGGRCDEFPWVGNGVDRETGADNSCDGGRRNVSRVTGS